MLSNSWMNDWRRYLATRCVSMRMAALAVLLLFTAWSLSFPESAVEAVTDLVILSLLLLQFRLWDDLSDVESDRVEHANRVLVQCGRLSRFWLLMGGVGMLNIVLVAWQRPSESVVALLLLHALLLAWYSLSTRIGWRIANYHIVLAKYPVFVFIVSARSLNGVEPAPMTVMACVYLVLCLYEVCDDARLRSGRVSLTVAGLETLILITLLVFGLRTQLQTSEAAESPAHAAASETPTSENIRT